MEKRAGYVSFRAIELPSHGANNKGSEMSAMFDRIKKASDNEAGKIFANEVLPLQVRSLRVWGNFNAVTYRVSPVFHEWFLETFPEPSAWLASRLVYSRSAAVMSMVGFILGYEAATYGENALNRACKIGRAHV